MGRHLKLKLCINCLKKRATHYFSEDRNICKLCILPVLKPNEFEKTEESLPFMGAKFAHVGKNIETIFEDEFEENIFCATFGCNKRLSLHEKLCREICITCMNKPKEIFHHGKL